MGPGHECRVYSRENQQETPAKKSITPGFSEIQERCHICGAVCHFEPEKEINAGTPQAILLPKKEAYTGSEGLDLLHLSMPDANHLSEFCTFFSSSAGCGNYRGHRDQRGRDHLSGNQAVHQGPIFGLFLPSLDHEIV